MNPIQTIREAAWLLREHNLLHFGKGHNTVTEADKITAALAELERTYTSVTAGQSPVAFLRRDDLEELSCANYMTIGAEGPDMYWPACDLKAPDEFVAVYTAAPPAQQPQIVGEVLPRWDTEKERVDGVRAHMHKELPIDTKLYAYLPAESKPLFPSGAPEAIEKARNLGMDLS